MHPRTAHGRWRLIALLAAGLAVTTSCNSGTVKTYPVTGRITYKGKPLAVGSIDFMPTPSGPPATGDIGPDGTYTLTTYRKGDGAAAGQFRVMLSAFEEPDPKEKMAGLAKLLIPARYTDVATSGLTAEVTEGPNTIDFDLK